MELDKVYQPQQYETGIYKQWEKSGAFSPQGDGEPFCIIMPPPNANGELHWGHAIGYSTEDIIIRYKRMQGYKTLWLPGTDHAGIETQFVFERDVLKPRGQSRLDLGPEEFYKQVMEFTRSKQQNILEQFRAMGFSADWSKLKFTLDEDIVAIVYETFKKLHADGHVYRGNRLVNWCPRCNAAFADIEIEHVSKDDRMYTLNYGPLSIATVRPETIFADVAVAVNPKDKRYQSLVGQEATIPIIDKKIPIIADRRVDPRTGTGALKVTPGHDPVDYEIGLEHKLPQISVVDFDGNLINVPEEYAGLGVEAGRTKVIEVLKQTGQLESTHSFNHNVAVHDRCGTVIEPLISEQWFLRIKKLNQPVIAAIKNEDVKLYPARYKKIALDWLAQEHDWCISRQIWWGIRIPVYYKTSNDPKKDPYIIAASEDEAKDYYGAGNYRAETDTFDTWFSSGQWPFATLQTIGGFKEFYPTSLMGTAREILHKWITRMLMFGLYRTGQVPFRHVYLWGLVTDEHGAKMSKSKGNVIDPLAMTAQYGTDALRMAGAISNTAGTDSPMSTSRVEAMRNFNNKLWNVSRYVLGTLKDNYPSADPKPQTIYDEWWLTRLNDAAGQVEKQMSQYRLNEAANTAYHLLWDDFADWYIETSKQNLNPEILAHGLENLLKLLHPFVPFITEAIWGQIPGQNQLLITTPWPQFTKTYTKSAREFEQVQKVINEIRTIKAYLDLTDIPLYYGQSQLITEYAGLIKKLAGLSETSQVKDGKGLPLLSTDNQAWLGIDSQIIKSYKQKLTTELTQVQNYAQGLEAKIANSRFTGSAPKEVVIATKDRFKAAKAKIRHLQIQIEHVQNA